MRNLSNFISEDFKNWLDPDDVVSPAEIERAREERLRLRRETIPTKKYLKFVKDYLKKQGISYIKVEGMGSYTNNIDIWVGDDFGSFTSKIDIQKMKQEMVERLNPDGRYKECRIFLTIHTEI